MDSPQLDSLKARPVPSHKNNERNGKLHIKCKTHSLAENTILHTKIQEKKKKKMVWKENRKIQQIAIA